MPYHAQRLCSITLLQLLEAQFDKLLYYPYNIKINLLSDYTDILSINIIEKRINEVAIRNLFFPLFFHNIRLNFFRRILLYLKL